MGKLVIFAEKPDIGVRIAATIGGCLISGTELTSSMVSDKKYSRGISKEKKKGYLTCNTGKRVVFVTWAYGHLVGLKQAYDYDKKYKKWTEELFPFIPDQYEIKLSKEKYKKNQFNMVKKLFLRDDVDYIINATDADREGELIFRYVYELAGSAKPFKRLWLNSQTEEGIMKAFKALKEASEVDPLAQAGRCRSIADWVVGANLTALATVKFGGYKNMISVGRVQTPTLAILVEREKEIRNFSPEPYWEIVGNFITQKGEKYQGTLEIDGGAHFDKKADAEKIVTELSGCGGQVVAADYKKRNEKPPLLYDLTALQKEANSLFGFSAQKTLDIAQKLYEGQYITYPRTDSRYLGEDSKGDIKRVIERTGARYNKVSQYILSKEMKFSKRYFNDGKVGSHPAIIPTYKVPSKLSDDQDKIYDLLIRSLLKIFLPDAIWADSKIDTRVKDKDFFSKGKTLVKEGWRYLELKDSGKELQLPMCDKGDRIEVEKVELESKKTKTPRRYTENSLLGMMETAGKLVEDDELREAMKAKGIGTPATRARIIEKLLKVNYIRREKKYLRATDKGIELVDKLPVDELKSAELTGEWEYKLSLIEQGKEKADTFLRNIEDFTVQVAKTIKLHKGQEIKIKADVESVGKCPSCGCDILKRKWGWGCSGWKKEDDGCKFSISKKILGKTITKKRVSDLITKGETTLIKGFEGKRGEFDAKLALEDKATGKLKFIFN